jgi:cell division septation protein DedD
MPDRDFFNNFNKDAESENKNFDFENDGSERAPKSFPILGIAIGLAVGLAAILLIAKFVMPAKKKTDQEVPVIKAEAGAYRSADATKTEGDKNNQEGNLYEDLSSKYDKEVAPLPATTNEKKPELTPVATEAVKTETKVTNPANKVAANKKTETKAGLAKSAVKNANAKTTTTKSAAKSFQIQFASLVSQAKANEVVADVKKKYATVIGSKTVKVVEGEAKGAKVFRVRVVDIATKAEADKLLAELVKKGATGAYIGVEGK